MCKWQNNQNRRVKTTRAVLSYSSQIYEISSSSSKQMSSKCVAQHGYAYKVARYSFGNRSSIIHKIAFVWISTLESLVFTCRATQWAHPAHEIHHRSRGVGGGGGKRGDGVSKEIGGSVRLPVWRHVSRQWLSKWRAKCSSKRRIKISNLSRKYCSDVLHLEIFCHRKPDVFGTFL